MAWIILTLVAGGVGVAAVFLRARWRSSQLDVGTVSDTWIAHHRADDRAD